jgi:predicted transcriptional regulator
MLSASELNNPNVDVMDISPSLESMYISQSTGGKFNLESLIEEIDDLTNQSEDLKSYIKELDSSSMSRNEVERLTENTE